MKNIVVTGGAGFIGINVVDKLIDGDTRVFVLDDFSTVKSKGRFKDISDIHGLYLTLGFTENPSEFIYHIDITNKTSLMHAFQSIASYAGKIDDIVHLAALSLVSEGEENPDKYYKTNVTGTDNIIDMAIKYNSKLIFASSAAVYGKSYPKTAPINVYGETKLKAEELIKLNCKNYEIFRLFNVVGAGRFGENRKVETHLIPRVIDAIDNDKAMEIYNIESERSYIHVTDVANTIATAAKSNYATNSIKDVSGYTRSIRSIINICENVMGKSLMAVDKGQRDMEPTKLEAPTLPTNLLSVEDMITSYVKWYNTLKTINKSDTSTNISKTTNPKIAVGNTKVGFQSIPPSAFVYLAKGMNDGATKYGPRNWRESEVIMSIYLDAIQRHLLCLNDGEDIADDSKVEHLAHIMADCAIILDAARMGVLIDDRHAKGDVSTLLAESIKKEK